MTTLGKILVFINLLFSLLVAALIIMVFLTRTNWAAGHADVKRQLESEHEKYLSEKQAKSDAEAGKILELAQIKGEIEGLQKETKMLKAERDDAKLKMDEANNRLQAAEGTTKRATAVAEAMK